eukprot:gene17345-13789_t
MIAVAVAAAVAVGFAAPAAGAESNCTLPFEAATLFYLSIQSVTKLNATASECCALCSAAVHGRCATWSFSGDKWTPGTPCHLSPYAFLRKVAFPGSGYSGGSSPKAPPAPPPAPPVPPAPPAPSTPGTFVVDTSVSTGHRQVFEGIQVELMADSIGSWNQGMPGDGRLVPDNDRTTIGVPHNLVPSEQRRFATEVMQGVRTIRLAMGLYLRGLTSNNKSIVGRWPSQMSELKQLQDLASIDGWAPEYWSPPPAWKDSSSYYRGTLASFNDSFLDAFSDSVVNDVKYLQNNGLRVKWWGLQNEPNSDPKNITTPCNKSETETKTVPVVHKAAAPSSERAPFSNTYAQCHYSQCSYYYAFQACAKKIRAFDSSIRIHANSNNGQVGASPIANDPDTLSLVDAWTWHTVSASSSRTFKNAPYNYGKLDFTNEMEYQPGSPLAGSVQGTVSNVNIFLNTLTFKN